jgi:hypothetical protein
MSYEKDLEKAYTKQDTKAFEKLQSLNQEKDPSFLGQVGGGIGGTLVGTALGIPLGRLASKTFSETVAKKFTPPSDPAARQLYLDKQQKKIDVDRRIADSIENPFAKAVAERQVMFSEGLKDLSEKGRAAIKHGVEDYSGALSGTVLGAIIGLPLGVSAGGQFLGSEKAGTADANNALTALLSPETPPVEKAKLYNQLKNHFSQREDQTGSGGLAWLASTGLSIPLALATGHPNTVRKVTKWLEENPSIGDRVGKTRFGKELGGEALIDGAVAGPAGALASAGVMGLTSDSDKYQNPFA